MEKREIKVKIIVSYYEKMHFEAVCGACPNKIAPNLDGYSVQIFFDDESPTWVFYHPHCLPKGIRRLIERV